MSTFIRIPTWTNSKTKEIFYVSIKKEEIVFIRDVYDSNSLKWYCTNICLKNEKIIQTSILREVEVMALLEPNTDYTNLLLVENVELKKELYNLDQKTKNCNCSKSKKGLLSLFSSNKEGNLAVVEGKQNEKILKNK